MYGSKSDYFYQSEDKLKISLKKMKLFLYLKDYKTPEQNIYAKAFKFFMGRPDKYDGGTLVKDLHDIPKLDTDPLLHDFHCVVYNIGASFYYNMLGAWLFAKQIERKGKGLYSAYSRFVGLMIASIYFVPFCYFKNGKMRAWQKEAFMEDYKVLMK